MMKQRFLCKKCRHIFDVEVSNDAAVTTEVLCPGCASSEVMDAPTWAPLGAGLNVFENDTWDYQCQQCKKSFKLPIPKSPTEEKSRKCIYCFSANIQRLTGTGTMPLYCG